ncbi:hypothetical protein NRB20_74730 [Nocardia sp. RB20]|uniref:Uncharacterized protein n=1 Tax=Nocardia macrotermitis TaxID=2585198 RepID=A0A7K0DF81_9NOCA|nr:hypothetical protein [Nocardia macrotermitis]
MAVRITRSRIVSDVTSHYASSAGVGGWTVSFLPGRRLSREQALTALRAAEEFARIQSQASTLGLTGLELVGLAESRCPWRRPDVSSSDGGKGQCEVLTRR